MTSNSFAKNVLKSGVPFGLIMGTFYFFWNGLISGLFIGLFGGALFGVFMALFVRFQTAKFRANKPDLAGEEIIEEGPANHLLNGEGVGGWLFLTDKRLFFKSHSLNIQVHELSIPTNEISNVVKAKSLLIIPNQIMVEMMNGKAERFVVNNSNHWIKCLQKSTV